jgi:hypothetical protein
MNDIEFEALVDKLFVKYATKLGGDHWNRGDDGLNEYKVLDFAKELRDILQKN